MSFESERKKASAAIVKGNREGYWDREISTRPLFEHIPKRKRR
jgi:hypothetical protein